MTLPLIPTTAGGGRLLDGVAVGEARDGSGVDGVVIGREHRLEVPASVTVSPVPGEVTHDTAAPVDHIAPPFGHSLRPRHSSPESVAAIRRNLVAVACVIVSVVLLGAAVTSLASWMGVVAYAVLVVGAFVLARRASSGYAPRHSRYTLRRA